MPWTIDTDGDLVNLDACSQVFLAPPTDEPASSFSWTVVALRDPHDYDGSSILLEGSEAECRKLLKHLTDKLHTVGVPK